MQGNGRREEQQDVRQADEKGFFSVRVCAGFPPEDRIIPDVPGFEFLAVNGIPLLSERRRSRRDG